MSSFVAEAYSHVPREIGPAIAEPMCQLSRCEFEHASRNSTTGAADYDLDLAKFSLHYGSSIP
ncbi:hypothetical protein ACFOD4_20885 [Pseudoroseomonas globiformis]|uniref:Uncharacterized protein n=1 Tax=Teichococcus globiformis TaxID=2307229 RepID=A0ABV7GA71_9PROT